MNDVGRPNIDRKVGKWVSYIHACNFLHREKNGAKRRWYHFESSKKFGAVQRKLLPKKIIYKIIISF